MSALPRRPRGTLRRLGRAAAVAVLLAIGSGAVGLATGATGAAAAPSAVPHAVQVTVVSVDPISPEPTRPGRLTVTLRLTNTTGDPLPHLRVVGVRGNPVNNQHALDSVIGTVQTPDPGQAAELRTARPVTAALGPYGSATVTYTSTTGTSFTAGLCLCQNRVYPLYFGVHKDSASGTDGTGALLGAGQTFVASIVESAPQPVQVSWVWPLLDRPHRSTSETVFTDDDLAASVSGGRLDDLLRTLELTVAEQPHIALTVLTDPDLLDELAVMAEGGYQVAVGQAPSRAGTGAPGAPSGTATSAADPPAAAGSADPSGSPGPSTPARLSPSTSKSGSGSGSNPAEGTTATRPGTGSDQARDWLARLGDLLAGDPDLQLAFTPYADPDVRSLVAAGMHWTTTLPAPIRARVSAALGGRGADTDIAWPVGSSLDQTTATALARTGIDTVIVDDRTVPGSTRGAQRPNALAPLKAGSRTIDLAVTDTAVQQYVQTLVTGTSGLEALPQLVAELAVRAVAGPGRSHYVVITPPRAVDPDPVAAARTILATTTQTWTESLSLGRARQVVTPVAQGALRPQRLTGGLSTDTLSAAQYLGGILPTLTSLLTDPTHPKPASGGTASASPSPRTSDSRTTDSRTADPPTAAPNASGPATGSPGTVGSPAAGSPAVGSPAAPPPTAASSPRPGTASVTHPAAPPGGTSSGSPTGTPPSPSPSPSPSSTAHLTPTEAGQLQAARLLAGLPLAVQRSESAGWAATGSGGPGFADELRSRIRGIVDGVHLIRPTQGAYTLGSSDAPLPISIDNTLAMPVWVRLSVGTVGGLPGLSARDVGVLELAPHTRLPVHIPVTVQRAGRFQVEVAMSTPAYQDLGTSLQLSVRSTALGRIGKIITYVAAFVLAAALLVRVARRWRRHRRAPSTTRHAASGRPPRTEPHA